MTRVEEKSIISPANDPFITQSLHCHFVLLPPGARDKGHGHQNEAFIYFLHGRGFDMHDGIRYDWEAGDALIGFRDPDDRACEFAVAEVGEVFFGGVHHG
jgi:hypothetical protein